MEEWQSSDADAFVGAHGYGAGGEVVGEVVEVFENDRDLLFCGSVVAASEQDDRGRLLSGEREERSEVCIARDDDPLFVACHVEEDVIVCMLQSALEGVDSVVACFAQQLSKSR